MSAVRDAWVIREAGPADAPACAAIYAPYVTDAAISFESIPPTPAQMAERIAALGAEPEVEVVLDDSWSTDRITPEGREKLRRAGFAPPAPRSAGEPTLLQLQRPVFRCPYCGSTETRLENVFGPTPCRSVRYCTTCRQPFEQFKTI